MAKFPGKKVRRYGPKSFQASETINSFYPEHWTKDAYQSSIYNAINFSNGRSRSFDVWVDLDANANVDFDIHDINGFHDHVLSKFDGCEFEGCHRIYHYLISNRTGMVMNPEVMHGEGIDQDYLTMSKAATHIEQIVIQKSNPYANLLQHIICPCYS